MKHFENDLTKELKDLMKTDLARLVSIPSVTEDREQTLRALDWVISRASELGLESRTVCDGQVGEIQIGRGDETVAVLVHVDVVPPGIAENWETDPFALTEKNGRLYGRGTQDDKGPLIASLYAMSSLLENSDKMNRTIRMIIGTREETDWADIERYKSEHPLPDYGFTPDGEFPICNAEKGILELDFYVPYTPGGGDGWYLTAVDSGDMNNTVPGRAFAEMTLYEKATPVETKRLEAEGKSIHSGEPELGDNAIYHLIDKIMELDPADCSAKSALQLLRADFSDIEGGAVGIKNEKDHLDGQYLGINTISVNRLGIKDGEFWFHVDIRYVYGTDPREIEKTLQKVIEKVGGRVSHFMDLPPAYVKSSAPFISVLRHVYEKLTGEDPGCKASTGGTYAQAMDNIVTWGPTFPGDKDTCHEENEFIAENNLYEIYRMYEEALHTFAFA